MQEQESAREMIQRLLPDHVGPYELTKAVLAEIGGDCERMYTVLDTVLPTYCRYVIGSSRRAAATLPSTPLPIQPASPSAPQNPAPSTRPPISRKQERIRNWWKTQMEQQYNRGHGKGYERLGLMSYEDLMDSAEVNREMARGNIVQAVKIESLANALKRYRADKVQDLPEAVFRDVWDTNASSPSPS